MNSWVKLLVYVLFICCSTQVGYSQSEKQLQRVYAPDSSFSALMPQNTSFHSATSEDGTRRKFTLEGVAQNDSYRYTVTKVYNPDRGESAKAAVSDMVASIKEAFGDSLVQVGSSQTRLNTLSGADIMIKMPIISRAPIVMMRVIANKDTLYIIRVDALSSPKTSPKSGLKEKEARRFLSSLRLGGNS